MNGETTAFQIKEPPRATEIVQQMAVYVKEIGIITKSRDDVLIPDLGQHGTARACQSTPPLLITADKLIAGCRLYSLLLGISPSPSKHSRQHLG
jgi:hypothetical protein